MELSLLKYNGYDVTVMTTQLTMQQRVVSNFTVWPVSNAITACQDIT